MSKDYNKVLKKLDRKKNRILYLKYGVGTVSLCLCLSTIVYFAFSKFTAQADTEVIRTTVAEFTYEPIKKIAFINDVYVSGGFPSKVTSLVLKSVSCTNGATATFDLDSWGCFIYFNDDLN